MESVKAIWRNFVTSGFNIPPGRIDNNRVIFINILSLVGVVIELVFGGLNIASGEYLTGSIELLMVIAMTVNLIMLRKYRDVDLAARVLMVVVAAPLMLMLLTSSSLNTGLFWLPMFPVAAYLILGKKQGSTALLILFLTIGFLVLLESFKLVELAYSFTYIRQTILSLLVLAILLYVHESLKEQNMRVVDEETQALSEAYKKIRQSEQLRDEFTTSLVHELRNAFVAIQKLMETWRDQQESFTPEKTREYIELVHQSASDNLTLVNNLLDVVNVDTPGFKIEKGLYNLREIVEQQVSLFEPQARKAGVSLKYIFDDEVPWQLNIDELRIKQVLSNLLSNALKHTAAGNEVVVQVLKAVDFTDLQDKAKSLQIKWYLADNNQLANLQDFVWLGVSHPEDGLSRKEIDKLFKKFSRLEKYDQLHAPTGRGLGLYVTRRIIEAHGGSYGVGSQKKQGVTFYVTLPLDNKLLVEKEEASN